MKPFMTEEFGTNPLMMSFYIDALECCMCGVLPEQGVGGAAVEAQVANQGLESGDSQTIESLESCYSQ